ncbi:MAG: response regulator [Candidatus Omnitrophota bacterium]|nr:response regulator [Candidatus Omnitrophota bacterium]
MSKILIVDDEPTSVALLQKNLALRNHDVTVAQDGMEGFVLAKKNIPDLIILDVHMPNLDGYSLVRQIKATEDLKQIPILIVTADEKLEERFLKLGVDHYIQKPFDATKIVELAELILKTTLKKF